MTWSRDELARVLEGANGDKVVLTFDRDELSQAIGEVEAHGLRERALVFAVVCDGGTRDPAQQSRTRCRRTTTRALPLPRSRRRCSPSSPRRRRQRRSQTRPPTRHPRPATPRSRRQPGRSSPTPRRRRVMRLRPSRERAQESPTCLRPVATPLRQRHGLVGRAADGRVVSRRLHRCDRHVRQQRARRGRVGRSGVATGRT